MGIFGRKVDDDFDALINAMGRLLHGKGEDLQRAVLTDIVSRWIMGHHPSFAARRWRRMSRRCAT